MSEAEFEAFYRRTARPLWGYLYRLCSDPELTDDLTQRAFLRFLDNASGDASEAQLRGFLFTVATNLLNDHWRSEARRSRWERNRGSEPRSQSEGVESIHLSRDIGRLFETLQPREKELLWLAHVEEADHAEIAAAVGVKEGSVKVLLFRARKKLAALLTRNGIYGGSR
ncbi:MAG: RNA polymerase sigma factor [Thermoanaerobaculia bacterium]